MKIIASSVIRSTVRGQSHGGLYVIDSEKLIGKQVLDWNYPHIRWDSGGGDRGLRGMVFYNEYLYTSGATHVYKFDQNFELVDKFNDNCFDGTHEMCIYNDIMYCISNQFDAIFFFDLHTEKWIGGFQHILGTSPKVFNQGEIIKHSDSLHLDIVSVKDGFVWYAGSTTEYLYGFNPETKEEQQIKLFFRNTHNAQFWQDGIIFNRSLESDTCYQVNNELIHQWQTPLIPKELLLNVITGDHARLGYTRGMAIQENQVAIGTSPAGIHIFEFGKKDPAFSTYITRDIRNSICGLSLYPWDI